MKPDPLRLFGVGVAVALAGSVGVWLVPRAFTLAAGPEAELIGQLKTAEARGLELDVPEAGTLLSTRVRFDRIQATVDAAARAARLNCTLDFTGHFGATEVSSLGLERVTFRYGDEGWAPTGGLAPQLVKVVAALEARRQALESGAPEALAALAPKVDGGEPAERLRHLLALTDRRYRATAWFIRLEREGATVSEEFRLSGTTPDRPVDESGRVKLFIEVGREFFFPHGLM